MEKEYLLWGHEIRKEYLRFLEPPGFGLETADLTD